MAPAKDNALQSVWRFAAPGRAGLISTCAAGTAARTHRTGTVVSTILRIA
jgi:hypothetical protein